MVATVGQHANVFRCPRPDRNSGGGGGEWSAVGPVWCSRCLGHSANELARPGRGGTRGRQPAWAGAAVRSACWVSPSLHGGPGRTGRFAGRQLPGQARRPRATTGSYRPGPQAPAERSAARRSHRVIARGHPPSRMASQTRLAPAVIEAIAVLGAVHRRINCNHPGKDSEGHHQDSPHAQQPMRIRPSAC